jgi:putative mRNA 3-end processing factor
MALVTVEEQGLYCPRGDFYVDPWQPVDTAVITHAHADHARPGSGRYVCTPQTATVIRRRFAGAEGGAAGLRVEPLACGEPRRIGGVTVSLHPAGHVYGSAQVRIDDGTEVWVITGDFKRDDDPTCRPFEPVAADVLVIEATFALPVYSWRPAAEVVREIHRWWQGETARASILFCYAFGKTQRVLAELSRHTDRPVYLHGAAAGLTELYREAGIEMLPTRPVADGAGESGFAGELVIAPPSAHRSPWMKRFRRPQTAFASGWMQVRGARRRRGYERGFVISDHADWDGLVRTVRESGARRVYATHGRNDVLARYLREELSLEAEPLATLYEGEADLA